MAHVVINDEASSVRYTVGGSPQSSFEIPFAFFALTDIAVYDGTTALVYSTDYTVTGDAGVDGGYESGDVALVTPVSSTTITVVREVPYDRTSDFPTSGPFNITTLNTELDRQVALTQQVKAVVDRSIRMPVTDSSTLDMELPAAASRANKAIVFDASGNVGVSSDNYVDQTAAAAASAAAAAASAVDATNNGAAQVVLAAAQVTLATTQAGIATTQAGLAAASALAADASADAAALSEAAAAASAAALPNAASIGNGKVPLSNGTTWSGLTPSTGTVTSITTGTGLTGGTITSSGTIALNLGNAQTWTAPQRGTVTTDNDLSFDQSVTNNFFCTPSAGGTLTFTNHTAGQSGFVLLVNGSNYAITAAATTKINSADLTTISATGTYLLSYLDNGTNAYVVVSKELTS